MLTNNLGPDRFDTVTITAAVSSTWAARYGDVVGAQGIAAQFVSDGAALAIALAQDWTIDLVVLDLALATPELVARLGPAGPRLLAFGDPANAGLALAANLADFIAEDIGADELIAAIRLAVAPPPELGFADISDRSAARLSALGMEAERIAAALARLEPPVPSIASPPVNLAEVRKIIRARRGRERFFPVEMLPDPAWDMLLDLTAARAERRPVSVSSLCIAASVPTTTALRWIRNLCEAGVFSRTDDPSDGRRAFIGLTEPSAAAMATYLAEFVQPGS